MQCDSINIGFSLSSRPVARHSPIGQGSSTSPCRACPFHLSALMYDSSYGARIRSSLPSPRGSRRKAVRSWQSPAAALEVTGLLEALEVGLLGPLELGPLELGPLETSPLDLWGPSPFPVESRREIWVARPRRSPWSSRPAAAAVSLASPTAPLPPPERQLHCGGPQPQACAAFGCSSQVRTLLRDQCVEREVKMRSEDAK